MIQKCFLGEYQLIQLYKFSFAFYQMNTAIKPNAPPKHGRVWIRKSEQKKFVRRISSCEQAKSILPSYLGQNSICLKENHLMLA